MNRIHSLVWGTVDIDPELAKEYSINATLEKLDEIYKKSASTRFWRVAVFLVLAYLYDVVAIAVFGNFSVPRYEDVSILLPILLTCLGAEAALRILRHTPAMQGE